MSDRGPRIDPGRREFALSVSNRKVYQRPIEFAPAVDRLALLTEFVANSGAESTPINRDVEMRTAALDHEITSIERIAATPRWRGFTLVELTITVAVVAILAVVAYPGYQSYVKRAYRSSAQSLMLDLANREQQYLLDNRAFLGGGASAVATLLPAGVPVEVSPFYDVTITAAQGPPPAFEVKATPKAGSPMAGEVPFTIDQNGTKLPVDKWKGR